MTKIGEIKQGSDIGKSRLNLYIWVACEKCGTPRWTQYLRRLGGPKKKHCKTCALNLRKGEKRGIAYNRLSLVGKRFTRLVVLKDAENHPTTGESQWECLCDCGNKTITTGYSLTSGNTKSCGCYHKIRTRQLFSSSIEDLTISRVLCDYRKSARVKGYTFELSHEHIAELINKECHYCGAEPGNSMKQHNRMITYQGIDRLDNSKGYTPDNVVSCCIVCNKMKKALSHDEFVTHILKVASRFEVKSPQADIYSEVCGGQLVL